MLLIKKTLSTAFQFTLELQDKETLIVSLVLTPNKATFIQHQRNVQTALINTIINLPLQQHNNLLKTLNMLELVIALVHGVI